MARARAVSNAEYLRQYEREVRRYVGRFNPETGLTGPGESDLEAGRWAWIEDGRRSVARWHRYAREHGGLKAMHPDGSWHPWDERTVR